MSKELIKYLCLLIPGLLALYIWLPIGDYSSGIAHGLGFVFFELLFLLIFIIIIVTQIVRAKKIKFDYTPVIIFLIQGLLVYFSFTMEGRKFWTWQILAAETENEVSLPKIGRLTLYKNKSFSATRVQTDYSNTYQGNYTISNDTLYLHRKDLPKITEGLFTTIYLINQKDKTITPPEGNFLNLRIVE